MRRLLFTCFFLTACAPSPTEFPCTVDSVCRKTGQSVGACVSGYCAFSDGTCASGKRWDQTASIALRNTCIGETLDGSAPSSDLTPNGTPDLVMQDMWTPDLGMADLALPDLATPDMRTPDLALPAPPDLLPPPQCVKNGDCLGGLQCCAGNCVDITSDKANCGACGAPCQGGWSCCQSVCSNTTSDVANCGACGAACNLANVAVSTCKAGACAVAVCNQNYADCDKLPADGCEVDLQTDGKNCSACGMACVLANAAPVCAQGACAIGMCNANYADCDKQAADGCEVYTETDVNNCGGCGTVCALANATSTCTQGACVIAMCNANYADCDKLPADGCEVYTQTDGKNCGACGMVCALANATPECALGACAISACNANYADCDKQAANGCEVYTQTDVKNCGACGAACALTNATSTCALGACAFAGCNAGYADCDKMAADGCEVNTNVDVSNCGKCGAACVMQSCSGGACESLFAAAVNYTEGSEPISVAIGDLNGDGKPDLAVANVYSNNVSVLLNSGNGAFAAAINYTAGSNPESVAIGDLNGDGKPDLAVANFSSNNVSILLNSGNGAFAAAINYTAGSNPQSVAIGDLNGDGKPDLAVANYGSNNVSVLLNSGNGTFAAAINYAAGMIPFSVAIGDLNGDGKPDLAVANNSSNNVSVLLNSGNGAFAAAVNYAAGMAPSSVAIGDLNGDGQPDLAVANQTNNNNNVSVLLNSGNGTFAAAVNYAAGWFPISVAIGDLNGDGKPDLAVANQDSNNVSVLLNSGNGAFAAAVNDFAGKGPYLVAIGDLNGDTKLDLAVANSGDNTISILLNTSH